MKTTTVRDVAAVLKGRRKALGWTQAQLADRLGVGREWVIQLEGAKSTAEWGKVLRAIRELGLTLDLQVDQNPLPSGADDLSQILSAATRRQHR